MSFAMVRAARFFKRAHLNPSKAGGLNPSKVGVWAHKFTTLPPLLARQEVSLTYVKSTGEEAKATGKEGDNLLDILVDNKIDATEGFGTCEGTLACSTCHIYFSDEDFRRVEEEPTDEELDMLDLAYGLTKTSRLACQVCMAKSMEGIRVHMPESVNNQRGY